MANTADAHSQIQKFPYYTCHASGFIINYSLCLLLNNSFVKNLFPGLIMPVSESS
jgi:hypothetical protein